MLCLVKAIQAGRDSMGCFASVCLDVLFGCMCSESLLGYLSVFGDFVCVSVPGVCVRVSVSVSVLGVGVCVRVFVLDVPLLGSHMQRCLWCPFMPAWPDMRIDFSRASCKC